MVQVMQIRIIRASKLTKKKRKNNNSNIKNHHDFNACHIRTQTQTYRKPIKTQNQSETRQRPHTTRHRPNSIRQSRTRQVVNCARQRHYRALHATRHQLRTAHSNIVMQVHTTLYMASATFPRNAAARIADDAVPLGTMDL